MAKKVIQQRISLRKSTAELICPLFTSARKRSFPRLLIDWWMRNQRCTSEDLMGPSLVISIN